MTLDPTQAKAAIDALVTQAAADQQAAVDAATAPLLAQVAADQAQIQQLEAELHPTPPPPPPPAPTTGYGVNASTVAQHSTFATLLSPQVWRYYFQPGETPKLPTEYQLGPGETFVISSKINPKSLTVPMLVSFFKQLPTDRKTYYCLWHEPGSELRAGTFTKAQYDAAWVVARQAQQQVGDHIVLIAILEGSAFLTNPDAELPADPSTYDVVGADPYFSGAIGQPIANLGSVLDKIKAKADALGKPWAICETGVGGKVTGQARIDALTALAQGVKARNALFCCYFLGQSVTATEWRLSSAEAAAWKAAQA